jgi:hypothetical protein
MNSSVTRQVRFSQRSTVSAFAAATAGELTLIQGEPPSSTRVSSSAGCSEPRPAPM